MLSTTGWLVHEGFLHRLQTLVDLSWIAGAVSLVALVGGLLGFFQANRVKSIIEIQKHSIETLETDNKLLIQTIGTCKTRLKDMEEMIIHLQELVTSAGAIEKLTTLVRAQHKQLMKAVKG